MKFLLFVLLLNLAYAQVDQNEVKTSDPTKTETKVQEQQTDPTKAIENPFEEGPYRGEEYIYFDKLQNEKKEKELEEKGIL